MFFLWKSWKYITFFRINWSVNTKKKHAKMDSVPIWPKSVRFVRALELKLIVFGGGVKMADLVTLSRPHFCWKRSVFHVKTEQTINISLDVRLFWKKSCWNHYKYWLKWNLSKILKITQVLYITPKNEEKLICIWTYVYWCFWNSWKNRCQYRWGRVKKEGGPEISKWI